MTKTYACKNEIAISKANTMLTISQGIIPKKNQNSNVEKAKNENPIKIFNKPWPDNMFANNLMDKLKMREK